jgi:hypothetical protein
MEIEEWTTTKEQAEAACARLCAAGPAFMWRVARYIPEAALAAKRASDRKLSEMISDDGEPCMLCGRNYKTNLILTRKDWLTIWPQDAGTICPECMVRLIGKLPGAISICGMIEYGKHHDPANTTVEAMLISTRLHCSDLTRQNSEYMHEISVQYKRAEEAESALDAAYQVIKDTYSQEDIDAHVFEEKNLKSALAAERQVLESLNGINPACGHEWRYTDHRGDELAECYACRAESGEGKLKTLQAALRACPWPPYQSDGCCADDECDYTLGMIKCDTNKHCTLCRVAALEHLRGEG